MTIKEHVLYWHQFSLACQSKLTIYQKNCTTLQCLAYVVFDWELGSYPILWHVLFETKLLWFLQRWLWLRLKTLGKQLGYISYFKKRNILTCSLNMKEAKALEHFSLLIDIHFASSI